MHYSSVGGGSTELTLIKNNIVLISKSFKIGGVRLINNLVDKSTWNEMIEMGWTSLIIPEEYNGLDFGYVGMGQVLEEMGRKLVKSPLISSILFFSFINFLDELLE